MRVDTTRSRRHRRSTDGRNEWGPILSTPVERAVAACAEAERLRQSGEHRRAAICARRALVLFRRNEGSGHPDVAAAMLELGAALEVGDRWGEALRVYLRADTLLARYARLRDPDIRRLRVKTARALCGVCRALARYTLGDFHGRRAVELAERFFGRWDLDLAGALNDLGMLRKYQGRYPEAIPLYRRALSIVRAAGLGTSADAASSYHNLGGIEHARGRYARAEAPARRAVEIRTRALGPRHPQVAADVAALAAIVEGRGR
jgi:tetratricopeptide (TPR) repeat protein